MWLWYDLSCFTICIEFKNFSGPAVDLPCWLSMHQLTQNLLRILEPLCHFRVGSNQLVVQVIS